MKKLITLLALAFCTIVKGQIITTIVGNGYGAGTGNGAHGGDGGQATAAEIQYPYGTTFDKSGNLYLSTIDGYVRKVNTAGIISTITGNGSNAFSGDGGPATNAGLVAPQGLKFDAVGNLYIAEQQSSVIRKINTSGIISTFVGIPSLTGSYGGDGGQATNANLSNINDIIFDAVGNLYISDGSNNLLRKINTNGIINTIAGDTVGWNTTCTGIPCSGYSGDAGQATNAKLAAPWGMAFDAVGNLYFSDQGNNRIRKINTAGIISTFAGNGTAGYSGDGGQATMAKINTPYGICIDMTGNLYVADLGNVVVRRIDPSGIITTFAGVYSLRGYTGDGGPPDAAHLNDPIYVTCDTIGNLFISDAYNNVVRKVTNIAQAGIKQFRIENDELRIYPNPTNSVINVQVSGNNNEEVEVQNTLGETVIHNSSLITHNLILDVRGLPAGVYFVRVGSSTQKFIKE